MNAPAVASFRAWNIDFGDLRYCLSTPFIHLIPLYSTHLSSFLCPSFIPQYNTSVRIQIFVSRLFSTPHTASVDQIIKMAPKSKTETAPESTASRRSARLASAPVSESAGQKVSSGIPHIDLKGSCEPFSVRPRSHLV